MTTAGVLRLGFVCAACAAGCMRGPSVAADGAMSLRRVVLYRNGVGYFERAGQVRGDALEFRVRRADVGDFLATLAVRERGGSRVVSAAFPMTDDAPVSAGRDGRSTVRLQLAETGHDLSVGYMTSAPIWRPSYRVLFTPQGIELQAWGVVQNLSGEDWRAVRLALVAGSPVAFRSDLAEAVHATRPLVRDRGAGFDVVPGATTSLAQARAGDRDGDAIADSNDRCPDQPEDREGVEDTDGCPEPDHDHDRVPDVDDRCPTQPETYNGRVDDDGCPDDAQVSVHAGSRGAEPAATEVAGLSRSLSSHGGSSRFDLPNLVTLRDRSAAMVLLLSHAVPGQRRFLFAPESGVPLSTSHPFEVAQFENRTGALLERGGIAIFEAGAFLGQGMLETLPAGGTATVPFALERGIDVESTSTLADDGARLVRAVREEVTFERFHVTRTTYSVRNGFDRPVTVVIRHRIVGGSVLHAPPEGTEQSPGVALVPVRVATRGAASVVLEVRSPFVITATLRDDHAAQAVREYLRGGHAPGDTVAMQTALDLRAALNTAQHERSALDERRADLARATREIRQDLAAVVRMQGIGELRTQLIARLARTSSLVADADRSIVALDSRMGELRLRYADALRRIDTTTPGGT